MLLYTALPPEIAVFPSLKKKKGISFDVEDLRTLDQALSLEGSARRTRNHRGTEAARSAIVTSLDVEFDVKKGPRNPYINDIKAMDEESESALGVITEESKRALGVITVAHKPSEREQQHREQIEYAAAAWGDLATSFRDSFEESRERERTRRHRQKRKKERQKRKRDTRNNGEEGGVVEEQHHDPCQRFTELRDDDNYHDYYGDHPRTASDRFCQQHALHIASHCPEVCNALPESELSCEDTLGGPACWLIASEGKCQSDPLSSSRDCARTCAWMFFSESLHLASPWFTSHKCDVAFAYLGRPRVTEEEFVKLMQREVATNVQSVRDYHRPHHHPSDKQGDAKREITDQQQQASERERVKKG